MSRIRISATSVNSNYTSRTYDLKIWLSNTFGWNVFNHHIQIRKGSSGSWTTLHSGSNSIFSFVESNMANVNWSRNYDNTNMTNTRRIIGFAGSLITSISGRRAYHANGYSTIENDVRSLVRHNYDYNERYTLHIGTIPAHLRERSQLFQIRVERFNNSSDYQNLISFTATTSEIPTPATPTISHTILNDSTGKPDRIQVTVNLNNNPQDHYTLRLQELVGSTWTTRTSARGVTSRTFTKSLSDSDYDKDFSFRGRVDGGGITASHSSTRIVNVPQPLPPLKINDNGDWKQVKDVWIKDGSSWKRVKKVWYNNGGSWK